MDLDLHPKVYSDIDEIMTYYEMVASRELADEFYAELRQFMVQAAETPEIFSVRIRDIRRVNLDRFLITFCFASWETRCVSWWCVITVEIPHWG